MKSNSDKNQAKLPWWVELLLVQIGLPDSWLSKYLKKKKQAANFINENLLGYYHINIVTSKIYPIFIKMELSYASFMSIYSYLSVFQIPLIFLLFFSLIIVYYF